ncbi:MULTISPECIES: acyl-CoA dehydrogenase family protein [unclassified Janthinobacterium]|uniref:acyl-CoA dehydrogenase family protein n=1 Tax=unclassified Janthinobacterium TaxID=2610881 RepID=UPI00161E9C6D|nr:MULTISPECIES: acyl-CoA dehydrogenase family protein [unclassified Janthinobacterium]MBB5610647.1 alkylation response protein AidB-like acyl-CoA dehydrogenase [Janthinobacterium sp. S3T4]MBB5616133.1 alkylation response protein AidB-like acyl-CoA dehydrogenase [Janthinobacterium sp. S3M3]
MDFNVNQEQQQFADALRRWVDKDYAFEKRRSIIHSAAGVSDAAWAGLAELGMTALPLPASAGGFDGTAVDMLLVMQELGRGLMVEPYFATVFGAKFLTLAGGHDAVLEQVAAGTLKLACALGERQARHDLHDIVTTATGSGNGFVLDGTKTVVMHGAQAGSLIVSARSGGDQRDTDGISLFLVPVDAPGVSIQDSRTIDGQRAATVNFVQVVLGAEALIGQAGQGWEILDAALDYGATLLCAEAVGAMDAIFAATLEYLKTRQQFGAPIGKFQALQHRMADMFIHVEQARSMAMLAAAKVDSEDVVERRRIVSAAKARVNQAATFVGQQAVQLHGGMGVTDELPAAHHFKRLTMIALTLGDSDHHIERFIAQPGFLPLETA